MLVKDVGMWMYNLCFASELREKGDVCYGTRSVTLSISTLYAVRKVKAGSDVLDFHPLRGRVTWHT